MPAIYLDNNATTAIDPRVIDAMVDVYRQGPSNPASQHASGRQSRDRVEQATERIGRALKCRLDRPGDPRVIFTSGGTESNNLALNGIGTDGIGTAGPLVLSKIEHPSVLETARMLQIRGRDVRWVDVDSGGQIRLEHLAQCIEGGGIEGDRQKASLVSIMSANNETGVIQPIQQAADLCSQSDVPLHVDATQSVGKVPFNLEESGAAAVTFSAHKFHGPPGIGALWLNRGIKIEPQLFGGMQQLESRPGTEPTALIVAMGLAIELAVEELDASMQRCRRLRNHLEGELLKRHPELVVQGKDKPRLPTTTSISFVGTDRQSMLMGLDLKQLWCSSGSACSSGSSPPSHVLLAMDRPVAEVESTLRMSVSKFSTEEEISRSIDLISNQYKALRRIANVEN